MVVRPWNTEVTAPVTDCGIGRKPDDAPSFEIRPHHDLGVPEVGTPNYIAIDVLHPEAVRIRTGGKEWLFSLDGRTAIFDGIGRYTCAPEYAEPPDRLPGWIVGALNYAGYRVGISAESELRETS